MRAIKEVHLKNFQSHVDTIVHFDAYNIIHGSTNSGKSAIIRGIKWALYNLPPAEGVDFRRIGTKETEVSVLFDDGRQIIRKRNSKENVYTLVHPDGSTQTFSQFGRGALKEVVDFHGMYQVNLFGTPQSINIVEQSEPPFFLSQGPTARGHLISRLADTLIYESALLLMRKDNTDLNKQISDAETKLEQAKQDFAALSYIDDLNQDIQNTAQEFEKIEYAQNTIAQIQLIIAEIQSAYQLRSLNVLKASFAPVFTQCQADIEVIQASKMFMQKIEQCLQELNQMYTAHQNNTVLASKRETLEQLLLQCNEISQNQTNANVIQDMLNKLSEQFAGYQKTQRQTEYADDLTGFNEDIEALQHNLTQTDTIKAHMQALNNTLQGYFSDTQRIAETEAQIQIAQKELDDKLAEAGVCPFCNQPLTHNHEHMEVTT